jgi:hypothetical protein
MFDENFLSAFKKSGGYYNDVFRHHEKWSKQTGFVNAISLVDEQM